MAGLTMRPAAEYGSEQMSAMLVAGAELLDRPTAKAAVHLLTYTELPGRTDFARHVEVEQVDTDTGSVLGAWVRDWAALADDTGIRLTGTGRRLLEIAASYGAGRPVDLREQATGLGTGGGRRLVEAVLIGAGVDEFYELAGTDRLAELRAWQDQLAGHTSGAGHG